MAQADSSLSSTIPLDADTLLDLACCPILLRRLDGTVLFWPVGAERQYGWKRTEAVGRNVDELLGTQYPRSREKIEAELFAEGHWHGELIRRGREGARFVLDVCWQLHRDQKGAPAAVMETAHDLTSARQTAAAADANLRRFKLALAASETAVWEWNLLTDELAWDPESRPIGGGEIFHPTGQSFLEQVHKKDAPRVLAAVARAIEARTTFEQEFRFIDRAKKTRWLANHGQIEFDESGRAIRVVGTLRDITERKAADHRLQQVSGRLLQAQDEERRHLARELHDVAAQSLATLCLNLNLLAAKSAELTVDIARVLDDCATLAKQCASEVRTFSYLLHPPLLDELGLGGAVRTYADGFASRSGVRVDLVLSADLRRLPRAVELTVFRVLQESLANILRHSGSKTASISLLQTPTELQLEVRDTGRGLDPATELAAQNGLGVGILGMRERLRQLGGTLTFAADHPGTRVVATIPLQPANGPS